MEILFSEIFAGIVTAITPKCLLITFIGVFTGVIAGALPGVSSPMALAILIPFTYSMSPTMAIIFLVANYYGTTYGGSITAILLRTPGTPEASCTVFDGYPMAQEGQAGKALGIAVTVSTIGGMSSNVLLCLFAPPIGIMALKFGPPEYFALTLLGFTAVTSVGAGPLKQIKALLSVLIGLFLVTVGLDPVTGVSRFTFGWSRLLVGFSYVPCIIGLFAMAQVFKEAESLIGDTELADKMKKVKAEVMSLTEMLEYKWLMLKSAAIGWFLGALPGTGSTISAFIAYGEAVRSSGHPEKFGTGIPEGIIAPETANNAATSTTLIPTLTLGIPGGSSTAVIMGAFMIHGIVPGPSLFTSHPEQFVYPLFMSGFVANAMMFVTGLFLCRYAGKMLLIRRSILTSLLVILCVVGSFTLNNNMFDVWVMFIMGVFGYMLLKLDFPVAPLILGIILGPISEKSFMTSMLMSNNNPLVFLTRPISGFLTVAALFAFSLPFTRKYFKRKG